MSSHSASAPGSLMLLGEYGVLYGKSALVCAIDKRVTVKLTPRQDDVIDIISTIIGRETQRYTTTLPGLKIEKPFQYVLGVLTRYQSSLPGGCEIVIDSEFSDQVGLGSSAAVTVACLAAVCQWLETVMTPLELVQGGRQVVLAVQGVGSGADIAASVYGGMVAYQADPLSVEALAVTHPITALYAGFKTPTVEAIRLLQQNFADKPELLQQITNEIGQCAEEGINATRAKDWAKLGAIMNAQQTRMESLGVSMPLLRDMVEELRACPDIHGAKISGSGLGDCVIGLGRLASSVCAQLVPVSMTLQGVIGEKI